LEITSFFSELKVIKLNVYSTVLKETNHDYSLITVKVVPHSMSDLGFFLLEITSFFSELKVIKLTLRKIKKKRFSVPFLDWDITISVISHGMSLFVL
jgi:hypothetical protein